MHIDVRFIYNSKFEVSHSLFFDHIVFAFVISGVFLCAYHHRVEQRLDHVEFAFIKCHSFFRWFSRAVVAVEVIVTNVDAAVIVVHFYHHITTDVLFEIRSISLNRVLQLLFQLRKKRCKQFELGFIEHYFGARGIAVFVEFLQVQSKFSFGQLELYLRIR